MSLVFQDHLQESTLSMDSIGLFKGLIPNLIPLLEFTLVTELAHQHGQIPILTHFLMLS